MLSLLFATVCSSIICYTKRTHYANFVVLSGMPHGSVLGLMLFSPLSPTPMFRRNRSNIRGHPIMTITYNQQNAMPLWCRFVSDCQEWAKWPLAASGARWMNRGGRHGRKRWLNWKEREREAAGEEWSSVVIPSSSAHSVDRVTWVSWLGRRLTVGRVWQPLAVLQQILDESI